MSQIKVQKWLDFRNGIASHRQNVQGPMNPYMVMLSDHFVGDTLDTNLWLATLQGSSDSIAINEQLGGACRLTTGTVDNDSCMLGSAIIFTGAKKAICEIDMTITDVLGTAVFVGFSDAKFESNNAIALEFPGDSFTSPAFDAAGFVIDADHSTSSIMAASTQTSGGDTTPVDSEIDWTNGDRFKLRIELDGTTATYWIGKSDDTLPMLAVASILLSVTAATLMCVTVQAMTRADDGSNTVDVHNIKAWQDE